MLRPVPRKVVLLLEAIQFRRRERGDSFTECIRLSDLPRRMYRQRETPTLGGIVGYLEATGGAAFAE